MREQERAPRKYELMTILHPEVPDESLPEELDRLEGYITAAGGEMIESLRDSPWGRRRLAYPIRSGGRDVRDGYYTVWHFSIGPGRLEDLERELKLNTQLIRYLIVSWEPKPLDPKEIEAAEIEAEDKAAAEYAAAQAAAAAAEAESEKAAEPEGAAAEQDAQTESAAELTAEAEAVEASGAEVAVEPVEAVEERAEIQEEAAAALEQTDVAIEAQAELSDVSADQPVSVAAEAAAAKAPEGAVPGEESGDCPDDHPIKGNASSKLYHVPGSPSYKRTNAEFCFASTEAAEAAGYSPTKFEAAHEESE